MKRAFFFDIDGTLVNFGQTNPSAATIEALTELKRQGHYVFIATGRPPVIMNNIGRLQELGLIDGYVTMNGAYCYVDGRVIYKKPGGIASEEAAHIENHCRALNQTCIFVDERDIFICRPGKFVQEIFYDFLHVAPIQEVEFADIQEREFLQISPFITVEEEASLLPLIGGCEIGRWHPAFADITPKGCNKQLGLDVICQHFGIDPSQTVAFGDGGNDIAMLQHAAIGIAMGQASPQVQAAANRVTRSVSEEGVYHALQDFLK